MAESEEEDRTKEEVKSNTIVKYPLIEAIPRFAQLRLDTDLRLTPKNWMLTELQSGQYSFPTWFLRHHEKTPHEFSSGFLATSFIDLMENVDVVADAEHIKRLLKMPFSTSSLSMMVHRIGKTVLLDEFDVPKHLSGVSKKNWEKWWRNFYKSCISKTRPRRKNRRETLENKNLLSKFLYRSLSLEEPAVVERSENFGSAEFTGPNNYEPDDNAKDGMFTRSLLWTFEDIRMLIGSNMPIYGGGTHPAVSLRLHDMREPITVLTGLDYWLDNLMCNVPEVLMCYHLDGIVRKYEFFKTEDLPRVEGSQFSPFVVNNVARNILSFLKSNATQPGHTYWLFKRKNDDFVKLYDLTSLYRADTEMHANAAPAKEDTCGGGDAGRMSAEDVEDDGKKTFENQYTVPVAILLYQVAKNLLTSDEFCGDGGVSRISKKKASTIGTLLSNCISLLDEREHPGVVSAAYFVLSNLCLADLHNLNALSSYEDDAETDVDEEDGSLTPTPSTDEDPSDDADTNAGQSQPSAQGQEISGGRISALPGPASAPPTTSVPMAALKGPAVSIPSDTVANEPEFEMPAGDETRAEMGLRYVFEALRILNGPWDAGRKMQTHTPVIPLFWTPLGTSKSIVQVFNAPSRGPSPSPNAQPAPVKTATPCKNDLGLLAWRIAATACLKLADLHVHNVSKLGLALKYADAALLCREEAAKLAKEWENDAFLERDLQMIEMLAFSFAGDAFYLMISNWDDSYAVEFRECDVVTKLRTLARNRGAAQANRFETLGLPKPKGQDSYVFCLPVTAEEKIKSSFLAYDKASRGPYINDCIRQRVLRRLGVAGNELGAYLMNKATIAKGGAWKNLLRDTERYLHRALQVFEAVGNSVNVAIVCANLGRQLRTRAHLSHQEAEERDNPPWAKVVLKQKHMLQESADWYKKSLLHLASSDANKDSRKRSKKNRSKRRMSLSIEESQVHVLAEGFKWEMSSTLFNLAVVLQDFAPTKAVDSLGALALREEEISSALLSALETTNELVAAKTAVKDALGHDPAKLVLYQFRQAMIQHRLGDVWHHGLKIRAGADHGGDLEDEMIHLLGLAKTHLMAACVAFIAADRPLDALKDCLSVGALYDVVLEHNLTGYDVTTCVISSIQAYVNAEPAYRMLSVSPVAEEDLVDFSSLSKVLLQCLRCSLLALVKNETVLKNTEFLAQVKAAYRSALQIVVPEAPKHEEQQEIALKFAQGLEEIKSKLPLDTTCGSGNLEVTEEASPTKKK